MIKTTRSALKGELKGDINTLKYEICKFIRDRLVHIDFPIKEEPSCDMDYAHYLDEIFGHDFIMLNTKNVEYVEEYLLTDFGDDAEQRHMLNVLKWSNIFIRLTIYRIGSFSYFNAEVDYLPLNTKITQIG